MSANLFETFNGWSCNPIDPEATYIQARTAIYLFSINQLTEPEINDLGIFHNYKINIQDCEEKGFHNVANEQYDLFNKYILELSEKYALKKIEEQQILQETGNLLYGLEQYFPDSSPFFSATYKSIASQYNSNNATLKKLYGLSKQYSLDHISPTSFVKIYESSAKRNLKKYKFDPSRLHTAIPPLKNLATSLCESGQNSSDIKCGLIFQRLSLYRAFEIYGHHPDYTHVAIIKSIPQSKRKNFLTNSLEKSCIMAGHERLQTTILAGEVVNLAGTIFPKHKELIEKPYAYRPYP